MELGNLTLEEWLTAPPQDSLKRGGDNFPFRGKYDTLKHYLGTNLHNEVTKQAIYQEFLQGKDINKIIYLNDHGPNHIKTVIERASQLLNNGQTCALNAREVFFLLNGIQIHDVGNFYGRIGHEAKALQAIGAGLTPIVIGSPEVNYIKDIAQVHGGKVTYEDGREDKNTISSIKNEVSSDGYVIRMQLLASILRFADELADDKYRADMRSLQEGRIPKGSEIFHAYAACLDTVTVSHSKKEIELHFKVPKKYLLRTFGKIQKDGSIRDLYLLDEIFERALKMHAERMYCAKFWKKCIDIERIWVQIEFYADTEKSEEVQGDELFVYPDITFTLDDQQYPSEIPSIYTLCPDLNLSNGKQLNGKNLLEVVKNGPIAKLRSKVVHPKTKKKTAKKNGSKKNLKKKSTSVKSKKNSQTAKSLKGRK